jgi:alpha-pyrone synthase
MNSETIQKKYEEQSDIPHLHRGKVSGTKHLDRPNTAKSQCFLATIDGIATGTPQNLIRQSDAAQVVSNLSDLEQNCSRIEKLYSNTRIETRHLAIDLLSEDVISFTRKNGNIQARMQMYMEHAVPLAVSVSRKALHCAMVGPNRGYPTLESIQESIRLIVFVSSTGFIAPGVDTKVIKTLGLRRDIARVTVNFMGCAAAMNGLRVASDHVRANPTHKALVICLEISSVNAVFQDDMNDVIIHSIFGDGCAAVVIGACEEEQSTGQGKIVIKDHLSYLIEETEDGIVLGVEDNGITCKLSRQLPDYIETGVGPIIENFLAHHQLTKENIDAWAIHPGGTRIIERAQRSLGLQDSQVNDSWEILRQYGNMLSPSVLFVMERMLLRREQEFLKLKKKEAQSKNWNEAKPQKSALTGIAFSFAPGIGVEGILFQEI